MAYTETPRTDAGNITYASNAYNLENFSVENSLISPSKNKDDLISQLRRGRGISLKTPRSRAPFTDRRNIPVVGQGEFTPLLRSTERHNSPRKENQRGASKTPAFLKQAYKDVNSPALPTVEASGVYDENTEISSTGDGGATPAPHIVSSAQSTPLAALPKRDTGGILADQGNAMTLREQENIINKIEKENFGLKLKIHFLEEALHKSGPEFNKAALKENTDLKVDRITLQKELSGVRKTLTQAERELEAHRTHLQAAQEKLQKKHVTESVREELRLLKNEVAAKSAVADDLRRKLESVEDKDEAIEKVKGDVEDLEADIRERDRAIEARDDEIDNLQAQSKKDSEEIAELYEELNVERKRIEELERSQRGNSEQEMQLKQNQHELHNTRHLLQALENDLQNAKQEADDARKDAKKALEMKQKAEDDLDMLRDEISNKSFNIRGLHKQHEEKFNKQLAELADLQEAHQSLRNLFEDKSIELKITKENTSRAIHDAEIKMQQQKDENRRLKQEIESLVKKGESMASQFEQVNEELRGKAEEKELLRSRHDALTTESQAVQRECSDAKALIKSLEQNLEAEKRHSLNNDRQLRDKVADEINRLSEDIETLHRQLRDKESEYAADKDHWEAQRKTLLLQKQKSDEQAAGLQRTIKKLEEAEGTLSGREMKLKEALESEKQRFKSEEAILNHQIQDLNSDLNEKRQKLEDLRSELSVAKEEARVAQRDQAELEEKVETLEDDIEVLQNVFDEEVERANLKINSITQDADSLRLQLQQAKDELKKSETVRHGIRISQKSEERLMSQLQETEIHLEQIRSEKQVLQDKLATNNIELHSLRAAATETKAERDKMRTQLEQMRNQVIDASGIDLEKIGLQKSKLKLENDIFHLREELKELNQKQKQTERELEDEIQRANLESGSLKEDLADLQRQFSGRGQDFSESKQKVQRLEIKVAELERRYSQGELNPDDTAELSLLVKDLATAREKETEQLQRESAYKNKIRDLKQTVARLERQIRDNQISRLAISSPQSSLGDSAYKDEVIEVRRQLAEVHQQMRDLRTKSRENEKELQRSIVELKNQAHMDQEMHEQERDRLEQELSRCHLEVDERITRLNSAERTNSRLQTRIQLLEKDIQAYRSNTSSDFSMAYERKDLHEMLKDAKLTAESLQVELNSKETALALSSAREEELRAHLNRIREERSMQVNKSTTISNELESLQIRYDQLVDKMSRQGRNRDDEHKRNSYARNTSTSLNLSNFHVCDTAEERRRMEQYVQEKEKKHISELNGLSTQIQWLRARCSREQTFREVLAQNKQYLLNHLEIHNACNKSSLAILATLGIQKSPHPTPLPPNPTPTQQLQHDLDSLPKPAASKKPALRSLAFMVIAGLRMQSLARRWAAEKKLQVGVVKGLERERRKRRVGDGGVVTPRSGCWRGWVDV